MACNSRRRLRNRAVPGFQGQETRTPQSVRRLRCAAPYVDMPERRIERSQPAFAVLYCALPSLCHADDQSERTVASLALLAATPGRIAAHAHPTFRMKCVFKSHRLIRPDFRLGQTTGLPSYTPLSGLRGEASCLTFLPEPVPVTVRGKQVAEGFSTRHVLRCRRRPCVKGNAFERLPARASL